MTEKQTFRERVVEAANAPFTRISSNVLLGRADTDYILAHGQVGAETVAERLRSEGKPVRIEVEGLWDNDPQTLAWAAGPRI